jgi:aminopeptidase N
MLHEIRVKIGKEAFFTLLANYAKAEKGEIAYPQDFWALMSSDQLEQTRDIRKNYLRIP